MGKSQRKKNTMHPYLPTVISLPLINLDPPKLRNKVPQQETLNLSSSEKRKEKENTPKTPTTNNSSGSSCQSQRLSPVIRT
jgi:hypothetical protein